MQQHRRKQLVSFGCIFDDNEEQIIDSNIIESNLYINPAKTCIQTKKKTPELISKIANEMEEKMSFYIGDRDLMKNQIEIDFIC